MPDTRCLTRFAWPAVVAAALALLTTTALASSAIDRAKAALREKPPNYEVALPLLAEAARKSDPAALYLLGALTENGHGVAKDRERALTLYKTSAALGFLPAKQRLTDLGISTFTRPKASDSSGLSRDAVKVRAYEHREALKSLGAMRLTGEVVSVTDTGLLLRDDDFNFFFVYTNTQGYFDDDKFRGYGKYAGPFEYTTVAGATKKIRAFRAVTESEYDAAVAEVRRRIDRASR